MVPDKSSTSIKAIGSPFLVRIFCTRLMMPPTAACWVLFSIICRIGIAVLLSSSECSSKGWALIYMPSNSFSQPSFSFLVAGLAGRSFNLAGSIMPLPNKLAWLVCLFWPRAKSKIVSVLAKSWLRSPKISIAPDLTRASHDFLLKLRVCIRLIKSSRERNWPPVFRCSIIRSITSDPKFLIAFRPKRMFC